MLNPSDLAEALAPLFDAPEVRVAAAPLDHEPRFAHEEERACVARAVDKRRREFATGRRLAHELLAALGAPDEPLLPDARRAPRWPAGFTGSICHSREWCVVAVAPREAVLALGVDHEPATPLEDRLRRRILRPSELAVLEGLPPAERGLHAKLVFSAKECLYKAIAEQVGEIVGFLDVELRVDRVARRFVAELLKPEHAARAPGPLEGRYLLRDEGLFTVMARHA